MIINLPGKIRARNLATELVPICAAVRDLEADTLTDVSISFRYLWEDDPARAPDHRRLMQYPGSIEATDFPAITIAVKSMLEMNGVEAVEDVEFSFQAWRGNERAQTWGEDGLIERMVFDQETSPVSGAKIRVRRPGISVRYRPHDKEVNLFAVLFGHDD